MMMMIFRLLLQQGQIQKYEVYYGITLTKEDLTAAEDRPEKFGFYFCSFFFVCCLKCFPRSVKIFFANSQHVSIGTKLDKLPLFLSCCVQYRYTKHRSIKYDKSMAYENETKPIRYISNICY